jgi:hypothetical protein
MLFHFMGAKRAQRSGLFEWSVRRNGRAADIKSSARRAASHSLLWAANASTCTKTRARVSFLVAFWPEEALRCRFGGHEETGIAMDFFDYFQ